MKNEDRRFYEFEGQLCEDLPKGALMSWFFVWVLRIGFVLGTVAAINWILNLFGL